MSLRPLVLLLASTGLLLGCGGHAQQQQAAALERSARAILHNNLPADGCTWVVEVDGQPYGPDAASVQRIVDFTGGAFGATEARVSYRLPEGTTRVECGWGSHQELPTIEVLSLQVP